MTDKIMAWSFSRYNEYMKCPLRAKLKFIEKRQEPQGEAMARGDMIHKKAEAYLKTKGGRVPEELKSLATEFREIKKAGAIAEGELAFTSQWKKCDWFDMKNCWVRIKIDAMVPRKKDEKTFRIIDFKTGKIREGEYDEQIELYGLAGLKVDPIAEVSTGELWFTDHGRIIQLEGGFPRKDEGKLEKKWEKRTGAMLSDTKFEPKPGDACRWCHFRKDRGGPCKY